ncbi:MAG: S46 family peptidase [Planctomycetota bacterium]|nr:S46 family peptidase [Planctomycetota bacterium]
MLKPLILAFLMVLAAPERTPDEGQWLPQQVLAMDWAKLKARGMELTKDEFWHPDRGGVLSAAVQINGCSATLVSADGLVVTNHHCAFRAIQTASTVERNYVENGFVAHARDDEIRAQGMQLRVVRRIEDVSKKIHAAADGAKTDLDRLQRIEAAQARLIAEGQASEADTECSIASFFNGRSYHMYYRTLIRDIRIVYAPARAVGEFGGDIDNWEWPRHTGDFTFLRAYVGQDGRPAAYSRDNVPYRPKHWVKVSGTGVAPDDLVMILGYPGSTDRYLSSVAVEAVQRQLYPARYRYFTEIIRTLEDYCGDDAARKLRYSSSIKSFANGQKNALGMVKGLARNRVVAQKRSEEEAFGAWIGADADRRTNYNSVIEDVMEIDREEAATLQRDFLLKSVTGNCRMLSQLMSLVNAVEARKKDTPWGEVEADALRFSRETGAAARLWLEQPMVAFLVDELRRLPDSQKLPGQKAVLGDLSGADWSAAALSENPLLRGDARRRLFLQGKDGVEHHSDPLLRLARLVGPELRDIALRDRLREARRLVDGLRWIEAQQAWRGKDFYPNANSTLRVSIASVKSYAPRDGVVHVPQTTLSGVISKETGADPFASPQPLLAAAASGDLGRFTDKALGDVPVCFLSDGDTTGGNSGSGVINGKGELVGLNFDRVFENVAGDYGWNADRSRNISVDIRYVLWNLEKVVPAPGLLKELGF